MLAIAIPLAMISFVSGHVIEKTGRFLEPLQMGLLIMTLGVGLLISLSTSPDLEIIIVVLIVIGLGFVYTISTHTSITNE
jgi:fucose permease